MNEYNEAFGQAKPVLRLICCIAVWLLCSAARIAYAQTFSGTIRDSSNTSPTPAAPDNSAPQEVRKGDPLILDLSTYTNWKLKPSKVDDKTFAGRVVIDAVPFQIGDIVHFYGSSSPAAREISPMSIKGIQIGRRFDDLLLVHHAHYPDADGQTIAYICLNYDDDSESILPIRYGVHLRDWVSAPSCELEAVSDLNTTICWRGPWQGYKNGVRFFKSKLMNPLPGKIVKTMDIVSARNLASYNLVAATVVNRDAKGTITPVGDRTFAGDRKFDSKLVIRVVDDATGKPIEGALVAPNMNVKRQAARGSPVYTTAAGEGTIPFPKADTLYVTATVKKEGYNDDRHQWKPPESDTFTFRLVRSNSAATASSDSVVSISPRTTGEPFTIVNLDGSDVHTFAAPDDFTSLGSPRWSRDDKTIVFDCSPSSGAANSQSHIFIADADGKSPRDLGDGTLPSLSPDGKQVVFSRNDPRGIWICNIDGTEKQAVDVEGWGAEWSPKKDELVYTKYTGSGPNLYVRNLKTAEMRPLLQKQYEMIYWGQSFSPDGAWICFKGTLPDDKTEMAMVHVDGQAHGFKVLADGSTPNFKRFDNYFTWQADGKHVFASALCKEDINAQLYVIDTENPTIRTKMPGQNAGKRNYVPACSSDGKRLLYASASGKSLPAVK